MVNCNCMTGAPACGQPFCPCLCCPCCLGDAFCNTATGFTVTHYDALVGKLAPCAIPFLVSLNPCCSPCYKCADATGICCLATDPKRPSASAKPLVIFASRTVKDVAAYTTAFSKYGQDAMKGAGVRACFSFVDREKENTVLQLMWIDSADDFPTVPADVLACYAGSPETDYCQVWGGWDDALKAKMEVDSACKFTFCKGMKGYIKSPAGNEKGFNTGFQPMIWIAKKKIKPGQMEKCKKHFQAGTDMMYGVAPAALGIAEYQPDDGSDFVWALRVFNDYNSGFKAHFPVPSCILFRMVWNVIPTWAGVTIAYDFSTQASVDAAINSNPGNKQYKQYIYDSGIIGPKPDFGKGITKVVSSTGAAAPVEMER